MKTAQERIDALHQRAHEFRRRRENAALRGLGTVSGLLLACLTALIFGAEHAHTGVSPGTYTGAAMLFESAGGYVLIAVFAFAIGVILAALVLRRRQAGAFRERESQKTEPKGEGGQIE